MVAKARCGDRKQEKEIFLLKESFFLLTYFLIGADERQTRDRPDGILPRSIPRGAGREKVVIATGFL
jgi:hypothetical protein